MKKILQWLKDLFKPVVRMESRYFYNGKPATPEQEIEIKKKMAEMDEILKGFFSEIDYSGK